MIMERNKGYNSFDDFEIDWNSPTKEVFPDEGLRSYIITQYRELENDKSLSMIINDNTNNIIS
ncbi:hypothetical protein BUAKA3JSW_02537 [Bacteroides uniformis]|nr:hypothetical protein BUAKA3JSW_02537 [Bacteroides uniformis]